MHIIVVYDIPDNKRREKLRKALLRFGNSVQKSVFEFDLTARQLQALEKVIRGIISKTDDNVRYYQMCKSCILGVEVFGGVPLIRTKAAYII
jgi:CRISPR-associated protein Cas2